MLLTVIDVIYKDKGKTRCIKMVQKVFVRTILALCLGALACFVLVRSAVL